MKRGSRGLLNVKPGWKDHSDDESHSSDEMPPTIMTGGGDERAVIGLRAMAADASLRQQTRDVLQMADVVYDEETLTLLVSEIRRANDKARDAFESMLDSGRMLNRIQARIGSGGYRALCNAGVIKIGEATASKLRQITAAIDSGKIPPELISAMPRNLSGAYMLASLPQDSVATTMRTLIARQLLPDAPIRRLEAEVKRIRTERPTQRIAGLEDELKRKRRIRERLQEEITQLEEKLVAEITALRGEDT